MQPTLQTASNAIERRSYVTHPQAHTVPSTLTDCKAEPINAERGTSAFFKSLFFGAWLGHLVLKDVSLLVVAGLVKVSPEDASGAGLKSMNNLHSWSKRTRGEFVFNKRSE